MLPTPIDRLFEIAKVTNIAELPDESFLNTLSEKGERFLQERDAEICAASRISGRAETYIPPDPRNGRELFVKAHELGHQVMPWHAVDPAYMDDNESVIAGRQDPVRG